MTLINGAGDAVDSLSVTGGTYAVDNGKITFTPNGSFTGQAGTVTYRVANELGETASAQVKVSVGSATPTATDDSANTEYKTPVTIDVLANDNGGAAGVGLDASSLTLVNSSGDAVSALNVTGGKYEVVGGKVVFTPSTGFTGQAATVTYRVANDAGETATAHVGVTVAGVTPTALNDTADAPFESPVTINVLANDEGGAPDVELDPASLTLINSSGDAVSTLNVTGGKYEVVSGQIKFTPDAGFAGAAAAVTYRVANETGATATATVQVTVASVYPHATNDSATTAYETAVSVDVLANDDRGAPSLTMNASSLTLLNSSGNPVSSLSVAGGTYQVSNGRILFTPYYGFIGRAETVQYRVADTAGVTATSTVRVTVGYTCWW